MRPQVAELAALGVFPHELDATAVDVSKREELLGQIVPPMAEDEARLLVRLFGEDDLFGLAWSLVHLIETAPGWPYWDAIDDESNRWNVLLRKRSINAGDRAPGEGVMTASVRGNRGDAGTQSLADVLQRLETFEEDATIFVADEPPTADTPALVCPEGSQPPEWTYLLEIYLAREVLEVWRQWRGLRDASPEEALTAVLHYAENDAYLPNDDG